MEGKRATAALWLLAILLTAAAEQADEIHICIVIRSYYAHGTYGDSSLINLLHSLKAQKHKRWAMTAAATVVLLSLILLAAADQLI
jgi:hypothetical protein